MMHLFTIVVTIIQYIHRSLEGIAICDHAVRVPAYELTGHVSQGVVEFDHDVVDIINAFTILTAILLEEMRRTTNRRQAHQYDLANIDVVHILQSIIVRTEKGV
jgi:hypothetical protein